MVTGKSMCPSEPCEQHFIPILAAALRYSPDHPGEVPPLCVICLVRYMILAVIGRTSIQKLDNVSDGRVVLH